MKWIKEDKQLYMSENKNYIIKGRYTYYQGWTPYYTPDGIKGEWIALDGMYKGKGSLATCRDICKEHSLKLSFK